MIAQRLASLWMAPTGLPIADVGRPVRCLTTTYTFHAAYFEQDLLTRFLGLRYDSSDHAESYAYEREGWLAQVPVAVLVDGRMISSDQSTVRWDQVRIDLPTGIQHSKVTLLVWEHAIRMIVGSANLTQPAYRNNREMVSAMDFYNGAGSLPLKLLMDGVDFLSQLSRFAKCAEAVESRLQDQILSTSRMVQRWSNTPTEFPLNALPRVHFVPGFPAVPGRPASLVLQQALAQWGGRVVQDITVLTPFVDESPAAQVRLLRKLGELRGSKSANTNILLPVQRVHEGRCEVRDAGAQIICRIG